MDPEKRQSDGEELRHLVAQCLDLLESRGEAAIDELCRAHPRQESELRRRIEGLRAVGLIEPHGSPAREEIPERLGEFRLLSRLGGGGMGVVYVARQEPLGREVALKLIRPEQLFFPGARERFRREIETIARLQHPGIVPVHTVGEEKGIPYFAMERVIGCTLADAMDRLRERDPASLDGSDLARAIAACTPAADEKDSGLGASWAFTGSYVDACLHMIRQAAEALEHAHRRESCTATSSPPPWSRRAGA
jgi:serine/threonine protein kinase